jgi:hypothetical protein
MTARSPAEEAASSCRSNVVSPVSSPAYGPSARQAVAKDMIVDSLGLQFRRDMAVE